MLRSLHDLEHYTIGATDGDIGEVKDFYFDDEAWVIRYFVVETGSWLLSRKVLIAPVAIQHPDWAGQRLSVALTQDQVKNSPDIDTDKPVSRQHEARYLGYYGYPYYWGGTYLAASEFTHAQEQHEQEKNAEIERFRHEDEDPHLRSCKAIIGYHIAATDGEVGHVESLLINEETWAVQYLVVNTSNWWVGHKVLIAPEWIEAVSWVDKTVTVDLGREAVKASPPYESAGQLNREREADLYRHYARTEYWVSETVITVKREGGP